MKVLLINGSPKSNGNTFVALNEVSETLRSEGVDTEIIHVGSKPLRGCLACGQCNALKECVTHDLVNEVLSKFKDADGLVVGSPVYYASPAGTLVSFLDRLFFSSKFDKTMKVGAALAVARRGGTTATLDVLNKYLTYGGFHDFEHAGRFIELLEQCPRRGPRRSQRGRRGPADHAQTRKEYGVSY